MLIVYHNKDMDGFTSGAILKQKYPNANLLGYDYSDDLPNIDELMLNHNFIIFVDVCFPIEVLKEMVKKVMVTVIDHHISFYNKVIGDKSSLIAEANFTIFYDNKKSASELAWEYCYPEKKTPLMVTLIGRYDIWRQDEGDWYNETIPFKFYMYGICTSPETFPYHLLNKTTLTDELISGRKIRDYEKVMNKQLALSNAFERLVFGGLRGLCINMPFFNSEVMNGVFDPLKHDIMVGFSYRNNQWVVSLRSVGDLDCSKIATDRGGGGHKNASGFEVKEFDKIFI